MRVFVTGGTGFVGSAVVDHLLRHGHRVTVLVHRREPAPRENLLPLRGDVNDPALDLREHDAVVHLVGILREEPLRRLTFEKMHVRATRNMVAAAKRAGIRRFLHMSANGARPRGTKYQDTKWRAEEHVRGSGLDWTVFRPSVITGPGKGFDKQWADIARLGVLPRFGKGEYEVQPVAREDVAEAFARALERPQTVDKVYEIGGPERISMAEYDRRLLAKMGIRRPILPVPKPLAKLGVGALQWIPRFPATVESLDMLFEGNTVDDDTWTRDLGIEPTRWDEAARFLEPSAP